MTSTMSPGASFRVFDKLPLRVLVDGRSVESNNPNAKVGDMARVVLDFGACVPAEILKECGLTDQVRLAMSFQISCEAFRVKEIHWHHEFGGDDWSWSKHPVEVDVPSNHIRAGATFNVQLIFLDSNGCEARPGACTVSGGILSRWSHTFGTMNAGGVFPVKSGKVPSLWSLTLSVDGEEDLDKPFGAAVRLRIDEEHFRAVFETKDRVARRRAEDLLMTEALTALVLAVASKEDLVGYFDGKSANNPRKTVDPRTVEAFLDFLLTHVSTSLGVLAEEFETDPLGVQERVRGEMTRVVGLASKDESESSHGRW
jgi:hypothetical protein